MATDVPTAPMAGPTPESRPAGRLHERLRVHRHPVLRMVVRRLLMAIPLLVVVSALSFVLLSLTPGDAARDMLGTEAPPEVYERLRASLGLDQPLHEQYWQWLERALQGDLGSSIVTNESVGHAISSRLGVTLSLLFGSLLVSGVLGIALGVYSAVRGGVLGRAADAFVLIGFAVPSFWLGLELIVVFAVKLGWLPATGYVAPEDSVGDWLRSLILPVATLSLACVAAIAKQTRAAMLDVLGAEHIRVARANGIPARSIVLRHALRNASLPVLTIIGLQAVGLLGGAVVIENVFALPGLGSLVVNAALQHDLPMVVGVAVCITVMVVVVNLLVDLGYAWLNPRVRAG